jgi:DNA polymerase III alpha subunit (gram-positive type)
MQLTLKATFNDGTTNTVTTNLSTVVAWERKYRRKASEMAQGVGVEDLAYLCYEATRATGNTVPGNLDQFISSLASIEVVEAADPKA